MKRIEAGIVALLALVLPLTSASAVDIENDDEREYQVTVTDTETSQALTLPATTTLTRVCEGPCVLRIDGVGEVEADEWEVVRVQDGMVTTEPKEE